MSNVKDVLFSVDEVLESNMPTLDTPWADLCEGAVLVCPALRGDVTDALYVAMAQFRSTPLTADDRIGKMKQRPLGYTGLCCKFCAGQPGFGRYFPGSYDSFLNGTNCTGIVRHIVQECTQCPTRVRETVEQLSRSDDDHANKTNVGGGNNISEPVRPRYGSRKRFFSYVWNKLRSIDLHPDKATNIETSNAQTKISNNNSNNDNNLTGNPPLDDENEKDKEPSNKDPILTQWVKGSSLVVLALDSQLVPDTTLLAMAQMQVCRL